MANSAFDHSPTITVPGSSTNTALVRWSSTGADTFLDSTLVLSTSATPTLGIAADPDLLTFGNGTIAITGAITGVTALTASGAVSGGTLAGTVSTATQNSITTMTGLTTVGTVGTGVWNGTAILQAYIGAEAINESKMQVSNGPSNGYVLTARDGVTGGFTWEAAAGGPTEAAQSDMEDSGAANANRYVSPEVAQYHPGVAKGHGGTNGGNNVLDTGSYNVASVTRSATGVFVFAWTTDFSSGNYQVVSSLARDNSGDDRPLTHISKAGSRVGASITNYALDWAGNALNAAHEVVAFGEQV